MENNDSPYIYEKPLRSKRSSQGKGIFALGLVALGTLVGGGAFANSVVAGGVNQDQTNSDLVVLAGDDATNDSNAKASRNLVAQSSEVSNDAIVSVPLQQAEPKQTTAALELPGLANQSYGNTSSATPSAGGSQSGTKSSNYSAYEDEEDDEDSDGHDRDDRDHDDDDEEYED